MPAEIGALKKLTKLNASHNNIKLVPDEFYKLTELQVLTLSYNCLESLNTDITDLVMLQYLVTKTLVLFHFTLSIFNLGFVS